MTHSALNTLQRLQAVDHEFEISRALNAARSILPSQHGAVFDTSATELRVKCASKLCHLEQRDPELQSTQPSAVADTLKSPQSYARVTPKFRALDAILRNGKNELIVFGKSAVSRSRATDYMLYNLDTAAQQKIAITEYAASLCALIEAKLVLENQAVSQAPQSATEIPRSVSRLQV